MGKITEIDAKKEEEYFSDPDSDASEDDHDAVLEESFTERLAALADILPPHQRENIVKAVQSAKSNTWSVLKSIGNVAWIVSTTAMVLVLPLMLEMEKDNLIAMSEQQQQMQQQNAQKVLAAPALQGGR